MFLSGYEHLVGGVCGGIASTLTCHPFDLLKIRYSANEGNINRPQYTSYWNAVKTIARSNGYRGLYQGLSPSIIAAPLSWGLYFHLYQKIRPLVSDLSEFTFMNNLVAGSVTGGIVLSLTNPMWVCKTRLCLQYEHSARRYAGLSDCLWKIYHKEGIRGFYRGFVPGLLGTVNGAIQYAIYNYMKDWRYRQSNLAQDCELNTTDYLMFSMASKISATAITFPYQVLRTRLQDEHVMYSGVIDCTLKTIKREGIIGMYKGMFIASLKQMPNSVVTYVVYEHTRHFIKRWSRE